MANLKLYDNDLDASTLFYGIYNKADHRALLKHRGRRVVYWGGTDILKAVKRGLVFPDDVLHVTQTSVNRSELRKIGLRPIVRPLVFAKPKEYPLKPMGQYVYSYVGWSRSAFYGIGIIKKIAKELPHVKFVLTRCKKQKVPRNVIFHSGLDKQQLARIYRNTFCGLRPIKHDGFSQTVGEMALMGRKTAWIMNTPCSEVCPTIEDYVKFILEEKKKKEPNKEARDYILSLNNLDFLRGEIK